MKPKSEKNEYSEIKENGITGQTAVESLIFIYIFTYIIPKNIFLYKHLTTLLK